jgi:hypothetical protein
MFVSAIINKGRMLLTILLILLNLTLALGQTNTTKQIDKKIDLIEADKTLIVRKFDINEIYEQTTDGGGEFIIYIQNDKIVKVEQYVGLSFGIISTIIYVNKNRPIAIIEREENFVWNENKSSFDYSKLKEVYHEKIYVSNYEAIWVNREGNRNMSDPSCSVDEYLDILTKAENLLKKK